jgi:hypothetical protein
MREHVERARMIVPIVSVQNRYSFADPESDFIVDYCEQNKIAYRIVTADGQVWGRQVGVTVVTMALSTLQTTALAAFGVCLTPVNSETMLSLSRQLTHREMTDMISKYRSIEITAIARASLTAVLAQTSANSIASGHREILLQTTQSWNGKPYTHYPTGQPQLTTIKLTIAPHTALP